MALSKPDPQLMSYEQAFAELEDIVMGLESNQKTLEDAMQLFERGQLLAQRCAHLLDTAELKVRLLGEPVENDTEAL